MKLENLSPAKGARKKRMRVGRGNASGAGRTSGRGEKGQKARSGASIRANFEGGQMPLYLRVPKIGFTSRKRTLGVNQYHLISLRTLNSFDEGAVVDEAALRARGYLGASRKQAGIKVLANGDLEKKLTLKVNAISASAKAQVEKLGGTVELIEKSAK